MPMLSGNLNEVKKKISVPGGTYNAILSATPIVKPASTGRDMLEVKVKITDPLSDDYFNTITHNITRQDDPIGWASIGMKELFDATRTPYSPTSFNTDDLVNRPFKIVTEEEPYKGEKRARIVHFLPV